MASSSGPKSAKWLSIKFFNCASAPLRVVAQVVVGVWSSSFATCLSISSRLCSKYLETLDQFPTSGVEKYILRKDVAEKKKKELSGETEVSGVEKYLKSLKPAKESTGVAKYMKSQSNLPQPSNVAKYLAKQAALSVLQDKTATIQISGVAKYLQLQDSLPQPSRVARYLAKQAAMSALSAMLIKPSTPLTGVAKYLNEQSNQPQISRVAKYMARQALIEKQKPAPIVTGVEKYMRIQA
jgi:hypothetical protein